MAVFDGSKFHPADDGTEAGVRGHEDTRGYETDALVAAHTLLGVDERPAHGLMTAGSDVTNRYELKTLAVGRHLSVLR